MVTFLGFTGSGRPNRPLHMDPPLPVSEAKLAYPQLKYRHVARFSVARVPNRKTGDNIHKPNPFKWNKTYRRNNKEIETI